MIFVFYECTLHAVATLPQSFPRRSDRRIAKMAIVLFAEREGECDGCNTYTLDISADGARIQACIPLAPGQVVEVVPFNGSEPVTGRVVWVGEPASEVEGQAGLEFLDPFDVTT